MKMFLVTALLSCTAFAAILSPAHATSFVGGFLTTPDERQILVGMSEAEVLAILGPPSLRARYGTGRGPTWAYSVSGAIPGTRAFYVDFDPDNRVVSAHEYSTPAGG